LVTDDFRWGSEKLKTEDRKNAEPNLLQKMQLFIFYFDALISIEMTKDDCDKFIMLVDS